MIAVLSILLLAGVIHLGGALWLGTVIKIRDMAHRCMYNERAQRARSAPARNKKKGERCVELGDFFTSRTCAKCNLACAERNDAGH